MEQVSKHPEKHPSACSILPRRAWEKGAAHGGKRIWEEEEAAQTLFG